MKRVILLIFILAITAALFFAPSTAYAITNPDTQQIVSARGYGDVIETGDILLVIYYDVDYDSCCPTETATQSVLGRYFDASASTYVREDSPFVFVNSGYGRGVMSIYISSADASTLSITHSDADSAEIGGNPGLFASPWQVITAIEWRTQGSQNTLEEDLRDIAINLEEQTEWAGVDLIQQIQGVNKLTTTGEDYLGNSIDNLQVVAPNLFTDSLGTADFIERSFDTSYETTLEGALTGTGLDNVFVNTANWWGFSESITATFIVTIFSVFVAGWLYTFLQKRDVEPAHSGAMAVITMAVIVGVAAMLGWFNFQILQIIGFFAAFALVWVFFLKNLDGPTSLWVGLVYLFVIGQIWSFTSGGQNVFVTAELRASITATTTYIPIDDSTNWPASDTRVFIESEEIAYSSIVSHTDANCPSGSGNNACLVASTRGANNTTAASHASGIRVLSEVGGLLNQGAAFRVGNIDSVVGKITFPFQAIFALGKLAAQIAMWNHVFLEGDAVWIKYGLLYPLSIGFVLALVSLFREGYSTIFGRS